MIQVEVSGQLHASVLLFPGKELPLAIGAPVSGNNSNSDQTVIWRNYGKMS